MGTNLTTKDGNVITLPSAMVARRAAGQGVSKRFTEGIAMPFPVISIKGKLFTLRHNGRETSFEQGGVALPIDVILVDSSNRTQKAYYKDTYSEGTIKAPDCWSVDGVTPDATLIAAGTAINPTCGGCPLNQFNSAPRNANSGKTTGKACKDVRRLALVFPEDLEQNRLGPCSMRLPGTSHKHLVNYINDLDSNFGSDPNGVVTRLSFVQDKSIAYPILKFTFHRNLTDEEYAAAILLEKETDERTARILASPPEADDVSGLAPAAQAAPSPAFAVVSSLIGGVPEHADPGPVLATSPFDAAVAAQNTKEMQAEAAEKAAKAAAYAKATAPIEAPLPEGWRKLGNGKFLHLATKQMHDTLPAPAPETPPRNLEDLGDGTSIDLDTGEVVTNEGYTPPANVVIKPLKPDGDGAKAAPPADVQEAKGEAASWVPPAGGAPKYAAEAKTEVPAPATAPAPKTRKRNTSLGSNESAAPADVQQAAGEQQAKVEAAVKAQEASKAASNGGAEPAPKGLEHALAGLGMPPARPRQ